MVAGPVADWPTIPSAYIYDDVAGHIDTFNDSLNLFVDTDSLEIQACVADSSGESGCQVWLSSLMACVSNLRCSCDADVQLGVVGYDLSSRKELMVLLCVDP